MCPKRKCQMSKDESVKVGAVKLEIEGTIVLQEEECSRYNPFLTLVIPILLEALTSCKRHSSLVKTS